MKQYLQVDLVTHIIHSTGITPLDDAAQKSLAKMGRILVENKGEFINNPHAKLCDPATGEVRDNPQHLKDVQRNADQRALNELRAEGMDALILGDTARQAEVGAQIKALKEKMA